MRAIVYLLLLGLAACQRRAISDTPPIREYSRQDQAAMATAYQNPVCLPLREAIKDYQILRDQIRVAR